MAGQERGGTGDWVLLSYRLPREPSTPRITLWRQLRRLGVAQLGDGLVALPADARTREQLDWAAEAAIEAGGTASVWLARPAIVADERALVHTMTAARAAEYAALTEAAVHATAGDPAARRRTTQRLRREWREITRRDFFPPPERTAAETALRDLAAVPGDTLDDTGAQREATDASAR